MKKEKAAAVNEERFAGFPAAGLRFLKELKKNNDRDWFRERKAVYEETVQAPMALLVTEVAAECRKRGLLVAAKDKQPVMRVYRDVRFSPNKTPYKTHVGASLKPVKGHVGEVYMHISPEESFVAAGFWMPERGFLQAWRESMAADEGKRFLTAEKSLKKAGLGLSTEGRLTRLPRGYDRFAESAIADGLRLTSFVTVRNLTAEDCKSAALVEVICAFVMGAKPLLEYGWKLGYEPKRDILEDRRSGAWSDG